MDSVSCAVNVVLNSFSDLLSYLQHAPDWTHIEFSADHTSNMLQTEPT